jgi:MFS family permease
MLGRTLTSILWGIISDRYGRKSVIIVGAITVYVHEVMLSLAFKLYVICCPVTTMLFA